ncbi:hypothetical protein KRMM14A1259_71480 [Krasilnikovia sp. MM14-A1259]
MVVPFGSARERRSRTTYRPTVTPEGSTHVEKFTGTTSSVSRTASGKLAVVGTVRQTSGRRVLRNVRVGPVPLAPDVGPAVVVRATCAEVARERRRSRLASV